jgi:hypothetical protein
MVCLDVAFELAVDATDFDPASGPLQLQLPQAVMRVSDLIAQAVTTQVMLRRLSTGPARPYLDDDALRQQLARGRVALDKHADEPDLTREIERARQGFVEGRYRMILDGAWLSDLDEQVELTDHGKLVFLRLTPLVGG